MEKKDKTNKNNRCHRAGWSFAEAFYQISQISDNPRDAMRHCAEAIFTGPRSGLDINDIWALLEHNGVLETFEVSVNANEENRMEQLVEQIRMHLDRCGHLTCILLIFYPAQDNPITMDEIKELFKALPNECDACWDVEIDEQNIDPILSATVLIMHEPQRNSIQKAGRKSLAMTNGKTDQGRNWSHKHDYPIDEIWNTYQVLAEFITPRLRTFKDHDKHGYCSVFRDMNEWNQAIQKMIDAFELLRDKDDKGVYTSEEDETIRQGLELFGKYFRYLWD